MGPGDYDRAKAILNKARHPGFVGRELFFRCATAGLACVARIGAQDLGVALVTKNKLQALSVVQAVQGKGVGSALMARTAPKFVSAIMDKVPWFERLGYRCVGAPRVGQNGKQAVQLLELASDAVEVSAPRVGQNGKESESTQAQRKPPREFVSVPNIPAFDLIASIEELAEEPGGVRPEEECFDPGKLCYPEQLAYVRSISKRRVLRKTRRAGGTVALAVSFLEAAATPPFANQLYVTSTLKNAKRLVWPTLKKFNTKYKLGGMANETEAFMRFPNLPNEPIIYLGGAKDKDEIEKIRGYEGGIKRAAIDEVQAIRASILTTLVDDVIEPSLFDYDGHLDLVGTPAPVCAGYFYEADVGAQKSGWEHFFLDLRRNPYLAEKSGKPAEQILRELRERRKWTEDNPTYLREYCGQWVTDADALALHYVADKNACAWVPEPIKGWKYVIAFDLGFEDADAIAVLGWAPKERKLRLVKEVVVRKQGITPLGDQLRALYSTFKPTFLVGDLGALGKKIGEELSQRWGLPVEAADKQRKAEHVALLDDALRTGQFLAPPDSRFAEDCAIVQWDAEKKAKGVLEFDSSYHTDIGDAVLYGFRKAYHWIENETVVEPTVFDDPLLASMLQGINTGGDKPDYR